MAAMKLPTLRGELIHDEPMSRHTTLRVGGPADTWYKPADREDLIEFLASLAADEPVTWLGLGSNLLVRDGGIRGTVIATHSGVNALHKIRENCIYAEVGVTCAKAARFCARSGITGSEFLAGIPGLVGGALAMNAGAWGGETWKHVRSVETIDRRGEVRQRSTDDFEVAYRSVKRPINEWFLSAEMQFSASDSDPETALESIRSLLRQRGESQPTDVPSCGSVFRNPDNDYAARLIEAADLKGLTTGGASVSLKHANFILNNGDARASDIESLIADVQLAVERVHGVRLIPEVQVIGEL